MDEKVRWSPSLETLQYSPRVSLWRHHRKVLLPYTASASLLSTLLGFFQVMAEAAAHCHFAPTVPDPLQPSSLVKHCANGRVAGRGSGLRDREFRKDLLDPLERLLCRGLRRRPVLYDLGPGRGGDPAPGITAPGCRALPDFLISFPVTAPVFPFFPVNPLKIPC
jgi:hypothetical protein